MAHRNAHNNLNFKKGGKLWYR